MPQPQSKNRLRGIDLASFLYSPIETIAAVTGGGQAAVMMTLLSLVAVLSLVALLAQTLSALREVKTATSIVETAQTKLDFARLFNSVSAQVETLPMINASWRRFKATLLQPNLLEGARGALVRTGPSARSFGAYDIGQHWPVFRAMPGILTLLTLLLTVAGIGISMQDAHFWLSDATANAGQRLPPPQPERLQRIADQLLAAGGSTLGVAIAGLVLSQVLSASIAACSAWIAASLNRLTSALDHRVSLISFETAVLEQLAGSGHNVAPAIADMTARLEHKISKPLNDLQTALTAIQDRMSRMQAAIADAKQDGPDHSAANQVFRQELVSLRAALDTRAHETAMGQQEALSRLLDGFFAKIDQEGAAQSLREIGAGISEVRNRLALHPLSNAQQVLMHTMSPASQNDLERTQSEIAALRTNVELAITHLTQDYRAAMASLSATLLSKIDHVSAPNQKVLEGVADIKSRLAGLTAAQPDISEALIDVRRTRDVALPQAANLVRETSSKLDLVLQEIRHASLDMQSVVTRIAQQSFEEHDLARRDSARLLEHATLTLGQTARQLEQQNASLAASTKQLAGVSPKHALPSSDTTALSRAEIERALQLKVVDITVATAEPAVREVIQALAKDATTQLSSVTAELRTVLRQSHDENAQQAASIRQVTSEVRSLLTTDLERLRDLLLQHAEEVSSETAERLRSSAAEVAQLMSDYRSDLTVTAGTLVVALQTLAQDMRRMDQKTQPMRPATLSSFTGYRSPQPGSAPTNNENIEVMLKQLISNLSSR